MNTVVVFLAVLSCAAAAEVSLQPKLVRVPQHDSAIIQSHRLGGNFAFSTHEAHAYGVETPIIKQRTVPKGVTYRQGEPVVKTYTSYVKQKVPQYGIVRTEHTVPAVQYAAVTPVQKQIITTQNVAALGQYVKQYAAVAAAGAAPVKYVRYSAAAADAGPVKYVRYSAPAAGAEPVKYVRYSDVAAYAASAKNFRYFTDSPDAAPVKYVRYSDVASDAPAGNYVRYSPDAADAAPAKYARGSAVPESTSGAASSTKYVKDKYQNAAAKPDKSS